MLEHRLERRVVLGQRPENPNRWFLSEIDADGKEHYHWQTKIGHLFFTVSELSICDNLRIGKDDSSDPTDEKPVVHEEQSIQARLNPGTTRDRYRPSYSMFGADREISDFFLTIKKLDDGVEQEQCRTCGFLGHTYKPDRGEEIKDDDSLYFSLYVRPETFARYVDILNTSSITEVLINVEGVEGFYNYDLDFDPYNSDHIKVLTDKHKVEIPDGCGIEPPRLGKFSLLTPPWRDTPPGDGKVDEASLILFRAGIEKVTPEVSQARLSLTLDHIDWRALNYVGVPLGLAMRVQIALRRAANVSPMGPRHRQALDKALNEMSEAHTQLQRRARMARIWRNRHEAGEIKQERLDERLEEQEEKARSALDTFEEWLRDVSFVADQIDRAWNERVTLLSEMRAWLRTLWLTAAIAVATYVILTS